VGPALAPASVQGRLGHGLPCRYSIVSQESLPCCKTQTDKATSHAEATMTHTQVASPTDIREVKFYLTAHGYKHGFILWRTVTTYKTTLSTVNGRLVIQLLLSDCDTATNKAAYASRNNDHINHGPSNQAAYKAYSGIC